MCSWYSTVREISGIAGIYFWSKLYAELSEQRWETLHCLVNNSMLGKVSLGKTYADGAHCPGCCSSLERSPRGDVRLALSAKPLRAGKSCLWHPQVAFTSQGMEDFSRVLLRFLDITFWLHTLAGKQVSCSMVSGWGWSSWLWLHRSFLHLLYRLLVLTFWGQESSLILCSLCSLLQSLSWD